MSYKALYRTYRPENFENVAGQKHIVKTLQNAVKNNKLAHAYLFCGPRGTGKTSIAKIFARLVNCTDEKTHPCGKCDNCIAMSNGSHPDIIEIDAASNNGVDEVRELIEKVKYAPSLGKYKVYIIDEVHMMTSGAFNALLKTIEEPPAHVIFIFATTEPQKVLPTIISRCQRYDFTKLSVNDMVDYMRYVLGKEKIAYEEEAIRLVAQLADGGMRDALSILDQVLAYATDKITVRDVNDIYGILTVDKKIRLIELVQDKQVHQLISEVSDIIEQGFDIKRTTMDLIEILKESIIYDYTSDISLCSMNEEEIMRVKRTSNTVQRLKMIDELMNAYDKYRFTANVGAYFEVCLLNMVAISDVSRETKQELLKQPKIEKTKKETTLSEDKQGIVETTEVETPVLMEERIPKKATKILEQGLNEEFILQLLVGANKTYKNLDTKGLQRLPEFYLSTEFGKCANLLREHKLVASGEQYLVVSVDNQAIANEINEQDQNDMFGRLFEELLEQPKKIFAITNDKATQMVQEFVQRKKSGTLPEAIVLEKVDKIEKIKALFQGNIQIEEK